MSVGYQFFSMGGLLAWMTILSAPVLRSINISGRKGERSLTGKQEKKKECCKNKKAAFLHAVLYFLTFITERN
jgi:hypothetical protein